LNLIHNSEQYVNKKKLKAIEEFVLILKGEVFYKKARVLLHL